jgi:putative ABC transport system ATP-binding protein
LATLDQQTSDEIDPMPLVELRNVEKTYRLGETEVRALRGVDLVVGEGEFVAVWGPSGRGKTSLLNLIGVIDEPSVGTVSIGGQAVAGLSDDQRAELRNRKIGFIFQNFNLVPVLSALENVMLPLQIQGVSAAIAAERAMSRLEEVQLADFARHRPDKMSGGQRPRPGHRAGSSHRGRGHRHPRFRDQSPHHRVDAAVE